VKAENLHYSISEEVFTQFPGYVRGVVLAHDVTNGQSPKELIALLREAEDSLRGRVKLDNLTQDPKIISWREAYRSFGAKPSEFRPSMEAMTRRVLRNQEIPSISALVDIGNVLSLRYLVPCGGHAIDHLTQDIELRRATGQEQFTAFGSDELENPLRGEIVFVEGNTVLTRRWTWRQAKHTLVVPETKAIELNVDGLPPVPASQVEEICVEAAAMIEKFCGGRFRHEILSKENPRMSLI